jgi:hypothetical protein
MATRRNKGEKMENTEQVEQVEQEQVEQAQAEQVVDIAPELVVKEAGYSQPIEFKPQRVTKVGEMTRKDW